MNTKHTHPHTCAQCGEPMTEKAYRDYERCGQVGDNGEVVVAGPCCYEPSEDALEAYNAGVL